MSCWDKDFRIKTLLTKISNSISSNVKYSDWVKGFDKFNKAKKDNFILNVYRSQIKDILHNCKEGKDSYLMNLGVLSIKTGRQLVFDIKHDIMLSLGYTDWNDVPEVKKKEIYILVEEKKRQKLLSNRVIKQVYKKGNASKVLYLTTLKPMGKK